jgi:hypothetical protein
MARSHVRRRLVMLLALSSLMVLGRATASAEVDPDSASGLGSAGPVLTGYGPNGSQDPALGFRRGGTSSDAFGGLCRATAMVRAYDRQTARWSNWLDVESGPAVYGPNGSQDPALGFRPGC